MIQTLENRHKIAQSGAAAKVSMEPASQSKFLFVSQHSHVEVLHATYSNAAITCPDARPKLILSRTNHVL